MSISYAEIKENILELVQKNPTYQGYFTDRKILNTVNEGMDYIAVEMFMTGEGWLREIRYLEWIAGSRVVPIPPDVAIINSVRWLQGDQYYPLKYDTADTTVQQKKDVGIVGDPISFRIVQNKIYLNPQPSTFGPVQLELEFSRYPTMIVSAQQNIQDDFDRIMCHWLKYYVANTLISASGKTSPFTRNEGQFYEQMVKVITSRNRVKTVIGDFGD
jgi:hypothetical protein